MTTDDTQTTPFVRSPDSTDPIYYYALMHMRGEDGGYYLKLATIDPEMPRPEGLVQVLAAMQATSKAGALDKVPITIGSGFLGEPENARELLLTTNVCPVGSVFPKEWTDRHIKAACDKLLGASVDTVDGVVCHRSDRHDRTSELQAITLTLVGPISYARITQIAGMFDTPHCTFTATTVDDGDIEGATAIEVVIRWEAIAASTDFPRTTAVLKAAAEKAAAARAAGTMTDDEGSEVAPESCDTPGCTDAAHDASDQPA